jgi:hypothetical protein
MEIGITLLLYSPISEHTLSVWRILMYTLLSYLLVIIQPSVTIRKAQEGIYVYVIRDVFT